MAWQARRVKAWSGIARRRRVRSGQAALGAIWHGMVFARPVRRCVEWLDMAFEAGSGQAGLSASGMIRSGR